MAEPTLDEALAIVAKHPVADVAKKMASEDCPAKPLHTAIHNRAHSQATGTKNEEVKVVQDKLDAANAVVVKQEAQLKAADESVAQKQILELTTKNGELEKQVKTEKDGRKTDRIDRAASDTEKYMLGFGINDPEYASTKMAAHKARIQENADGKIEVLQPDGSIIPFPEVHGDKALKVLAKELFESASDGWKTSKVDTGGAGTGTPGGGGGGGSKDTTTVATIVEEKTTSGDYSL